MTTSLRLAAVAIGTVLLTTGAFAENPKSFQGVVLVAPSGSTTTPTLVQQLTANLAYQLHELEEEPGLNYHYYASQRLQKQLTAALAAAAAGNPLPPILQENGQVAPINPYVAASAPAVLTPPPAPPSGNVLSRAASALVAALSGDDGTAPLNPDSGLPSSNPDSGVPSSNPDGGGSTSVSSISSAHSATTVASVTGGDGGTPSSNPDSGVRSSNPDRGAGAAGGGG